MRDALKVFNRSIYDAYHHLGFLLKFTILWWLSVLPIITVGPATAGLFYVIRKKRLGLHVTKKDYFLGFRKYFKLGIQLSFIHLFITVPGIFYVTYLFTLGFLLANIIGVVLMYLLILWHLIVFYMFPLIVEQKQHNFLIVFKRSLRLVSENYFFTINIALYLLIVTLICSIFTILMIVWTGVLVWISYTSMYFLLHKYNPDEYTFDYNINWKGLVKPWNK